MRRNFLLLIFFASFLHIQAQFAFEIKKGPLIKAHGFDLVDPFIGGMNAPQFTEFDLNNDNKKDLIVFDRTDNTIMPFLRSQKNNFIYAPEYIAQLPVGKNIYAARDMNSDGLLDIFTTTETGDLLIYINKTKEGESRLTFETPGPWYYRNHYDDNFPILYNPLSFSNAYTDLIGIEDMDGDGDIDIINYDQFNLTYMMFKDVRTEKMWPKDSFEFQNMDYCFGYFWEGFDGEIKLNNCPFNLNFPLKLKPRHVGGASCWFFDEDDDGDMEMYLSNLDSKKITRLKNGKADFQHDYDTMVNVDTLFLGGKSFDAFVFPSGYMIDFDADGLKDMIIAPNAGFESKERNQVHYYRNTGTAKQAKFEFQKDNLITEQMVDLGANSSPAFIDEDGDGDLDLLVLNNGDYQITSGKQDRIALFENIGTKDNPVFSLKNEDFLNLSDSFFSGSSLSVGDLDNDGKNDILIGTLSGKLYFFKKENNQWLFKSNNLVNYQLQKGETSWSPAVIDYNNDGINDLLIGLYNGNSLLFKGLPSSNLPTFEWVSSSAWGMKSNLWITNTSEPKFSSYGYASPAVADINGDGKKEVILGGYDNIIRIYYVHGHDPNDSLLADENILFHVSNESDSVPFNLGSKLKPALGDIAGDSIPELIIGNIKGGLNFASHINSSKVSISNQSAEITKKYPYPMPLKSGSILHILSPNELFRWEMKIYDLSGSEKFHSFINPNERGVGVKPEGLAPGMYFLVLNQESQNLQVNYKLLITE